MSPVVFWLVKHIYELFPILKIILHLVGLYNMYLKNINY